MSEESNEDESPLYLDTHTTRLTTLLSRRSQSALEYMMTYGWAILIIVIVAAVLYSMGIFNPSSSASATVTGFSGLGSVTAQCYSNGILRIQLGDSLGNTINITKITATGNGGTASFTGNSTFDPNPEISPDGTYTFSLSNICPSAGSRFSVSFSINYTEPSQVFSGSYISTGIVSGTVSSTNSSAAVGYFYGGSQAFNIQNPPRLGPRILRFPPGFTKPPISARGGKKSLEITMGGRALFI
jgi:hypothetical protein